MLAASHSQAHWPSLRGAGPASFFFRARIFSRSRSLSSAGAGGFAGAFPGGFPWRGAFPGPLRGGARFFPGP